MPTAATHHRPAVVTRRSSSHSRSSSTSSLGKKGGTFGGGLGMTTGGPSSDAGSMAPPKLRKKSTSDGVSALFWLCSNRRSGGCRGRRGGGEREGERGKGDLVPTQLSCSLLPLSRPLSLLLHLLKRYKLVMLTLLLLLYTALFPPYPSSFLQSRPSHLSSV